MLKKIREFFQKKSSEKGQGTVEYALILGFVAIIAVYMLTGSGLSSDAEKNVANADAVAAGMDDAFGKANGATTSLPAATTVTPKSKPTG